ncbi:MAG TPA: glucosaminidase domain-containing protein [Prolixibacteraceae bacterium]|nr:glucosaminidase domain-containing protein [Prolixibacteraceae bacterium]
MKRNISFIFIAFLALTTTAQHSREDYIKKYQLLAIEEMNRSGIPASITMAQGCLESGNGNSELSQKSNNHFGIKCKSTWRGKKVYYDDDHKNECFRKYKSVEDSYIDHSDFLVGNPRYAFLFDLPPDDYKGWAKGLKKAGYATAPNYHQLLIKIIEDHQLYRLDYKMNLNEMTAYKGNKLNPNVSQEMTLNPFQSHTIKRFNGLKAVVAREGDTFEMIAQELDKRDWELYKFNDHQKGYVPQPGEVIYIQPKRGRAAKKHPTHVVEEGETMHYISQMYGIRLKPLYRRNNMDWGEQPAVSEVVNLRKRKKD